MKETVADRSKHKENTHRWPENEILSHHSVLYLSSHGDMLCFYKQGDGNKVTSLEEGCRFRRSQDLDSWLLQNLRSSPSFPPQQ